jgi:CubicO group peptidase (beta-lactamase class C family)
MKVKTIRLAILFCAWIAATPAAATDFSAADRQIQQWLNAGYYPGAGLWIVARDGTTLHERYWNGYTRETNVMIASSSKWIEAATFMALVDEGKFELDKPISDYLPELKGSPQGRNTPRQMLSHTSTLNWIDFPPDKSDAGIDQFPALLAAGHTDVRPGEIFHYGGTDLATAARAVEVTTGKPWLTEFGEKIARPCLMKHTVTGHNLWTYDGIVGSSTFPTSNAADYMNFLLMILNDGQFQGKQVLSPQAIQEMEADQVKGAKVDGPEYPAQTLGQKHHGVYGLGEWRLTEDSSGEALVLSSPSFAGFFPWIDKKHGIAGVFVARTNDGISHFDAFRASAVLVQVINNAFDHTTESKH